MWVRLSPSNCKNDWPISNSMNYERDKNVTKVSTACTSNEIQADNIGEKDKMAIVVTKEPIDYNQINTAINKAQGDYKTKVENALNAMALSHVEYSANKGRIAFTAESENKNAVVSVIEIDKK